MLTIKKMIADAIVAEIRQKNAAIELDTDTVCSMLEYPPDAQMGDLALPCFKLSRLLRNAPVRIAESLVGALSLPCVARAEAVNGC